MLDEEVGRGANIGPVCGAALINVKKKQKKTICVEKQILDLILKREKKETPQEKRKNFCQAVMYRKKKATKNSQGLLKNLAYQVLLQIIAIEPIPAPRQTGRFPLIVVGP